MIITLNLRIPANSIINPTSRITEFKSLVFEGFKRLPLNGQIFHWLLLVDPQYGADILQDSAYASYSSRCSHRASWILSVYNGFVEQNCTNTYWVARLSGSSRYFGITTLIFQLEKERQLTQLKRLEEICQLLDRRLMLELILPAHLSQDGTAMAAAIEEVYEAQITPFWWKIMALDTKMEWQQVTDALDRHDSEAGIIVLGKNAPLETFQLGSRRSAPLRTHADSLLGDQSSGSHGNRSLVAPWLLRRFLPSLKRTM